MVEIHTVISVIVII